jgi:hypothetical protein
LGKWSSVGGDVPYGTSTGSVAGGWRSMPGWLSRRPVPVAVQPAAPVGEEVTKLGLSEHLEGRKPSPGGVGAEEVWRGRGGGGGQPARIAQNSASPNCCAACSSTRWGVKDGFVGAASTG